MGPQAIPPPPPPPAKRATPGWVIALIAVGCCLGLCCVAGVGVALILPAVIRARFVANERSMAMSLKEIASAEETAAMTLFNGSYWAHDTAGLYYVEETDGIHVKFLADIRLAQADLARGAAVARQAGSRWAYRSPAGLPFADRAGYVLRSHSTAQAQAVRGVASTYRFVAAPVRVNRTGSHAYIVDEEATVYKRLWNGAPEIPVSAAGAADLESGYMNHWPLAVEKRNVWRQASEP